MDHDTATPTKVAPMAFFITPDHSSDLPSPVAEIDSPSRPSLGRQNTSESGLAARRAASGKLPNKALLSLQQMRFESHATTGLGVGPGSAGFEGMEGISPGLPSGPGFAFRTALGLSDVEKGKDAVSSRPSTPTGENRASSPTTLGSPSLLRSPSSRRRSPLPRSPGATFNSDPFATTAADVKIPPSLRGSKILDKLNLSSNSLHSPLSPTRERPAPYPAPPSPLIRTSAFTYSNTGPLTPLTPSHVPGAPTLAGGGSFDWFAYSMPDSPGCPTPPSLPADKGPLPPSPTKTGFFLPTPTSAGDRLGRHPLPASPLGTGRFASGTTNPFFSST